MARNCASVPKQSVDPAHLYDLLHGDGVVLAGWGRVSEGLRPEFQHLPTAISIARPYPRLPGGAGVSPAEFRMNLQETGPVLQAVQKRVVAFLRAHGWRYLAIPPHHDRMDTRFVARLFSRFPHKTAVTCAGLGWVGKSGLVVSPGHGPRLIWATVLTDCPLPTVREPYVRGRCGSCRRCVDTCPAAALRDQEWDRENPYSPGVDRDACRGFLLRRSSDGGVPCLVCLQVCPA